MLMLRSIHEWLMFAVGRDDGRQAEVWQGARTSRDAVSALDGPTWLDSGGRSAWNWISTCILQVCMSFDVRARSFVHWGRPPPECPCVHSSAVGVNDLPIEVAGQIKYVCIRT